MYYPSWHRQGNARTLNILSNFDYSWVKSLSWSNQFPTTTWISQCSMFIFFPYPFKIPPTSGNILGVWCQAESRNLSARGALKNIAVRLENASMCLEGGDRWRGAPMHLLEVIWRNWALCLYFLKTQPFIFHSYIWKATVCSHPGTRKKKKENKLATRTEIGSKSRRSIGAIKQSYT